MIHETPTKRHELIGVISCDFVDRPDFCAELADTQMEETEIGALQKNANLNGNSCWLVSLLTL